MILKDYKNLESRAHRLESKKNKVFKKAYLELRDSFIYSFVDFQGNKTSISHALAKEIIKYKPRFKKLQSSN